MQKRKHYFVTVLVSRFAIAAQHAIARPRLCVTCLAAAILAAVLAQSPMRYASQSPRCRLLQPNTSLLLVAKVPTLALPCSSFPLALQYTYINALCISTQAVLHMLTSACLAIAVLYLTLASETTQLLRLGIVDEDVVFLQHDVTMCNRSCYILLCAIMDATAPRPSPPPIHFIQQ